MGKEKKAHQRVHTSKLAFAMGTGKYFLKLPLQLQVSRRAPVPERWSAISAVIKKINMSSPFSFYAPLRVCSTTASRGTSRRQHLSHFLCRWQTGQEFLGTLGTLHGEQPKEFLVPQKKSQRLRQAMTEINADKIFL